MSIVREFICSPCERAEVRGFIEQHHYSHNINGCSADYCFKLTHNAVMIGAAFFGRLAMAGQWKPYGASIEDVIELRRLVCVDDTPKNTESFFIGHMLRWLKANTKIKVVLSYAGSEHGHSGIIYRASNFAYRGLTAGADVIVWGEKRYHDKALRTKYKGKLKPFFVRLNAALLLGEAHRAKTSGKHVFTYKLRG